MYAICLSLTYSPCACQYMMPVHCTHAQFGSTILGAEYGNKTLSNHLLAVFLHITTNRVFRPENLDSQEFKTAIVEVIPAFIVNTTLSTTSTSNQLY